MFTILTVKLRPKEYLLNNKVRNSINLIVCVLVAMQLHAQSVFNILDPACFGYSNCMYSQGQLFGSGVVFNTNTSSVMLSRFDMFGIQNIADTFSVDGIVTHNGRITRLNNKLLIYNLKNVTAPYSSSTIDLQLTFCDTNFNYLNSITFGGGGQENLAGIEVDNDQIYLFGVTDSYGNGLADLYLNKFDTLGNQIWARTYGGTDVDDSRSFAQTKDGNLILLGVRRVVSPNWDLYLVKVDKSDGSIIWEKQYGGPLNDYAGEITALNDHSFIVYHNINDGTNTIGYIDKLDGNGDLVWSKPFPYNDYSSFAYAKTIENVDGTLLVVCTVKNSTGKPIGRVLKLTPFGDIIWSKEYYIRTDAPQYIYDAKLMGDGGYVFCGSAFPVGVNTQQGWLFKTNCNGEEGSQYPVTGTPCDQYDCNMYPIDASFIPSTTIIDLAAEPGLISFQNNSQNTTSRVWHFGDGNIDYTDSIINHNYTQPGVYEVELIVYHGMCSDTVTQTIEVINTVGLSSPYIEFGLNVYPNPSNGDFNVDFKYAPQGEMSIVDITGRIFNTVQLDGHSKEFSFSNLPNGIYTLVVNYVNGNIGTKRIIIE